MIGCLHIIFMACHNWASGSSPLGCRLYQILPIFSLLMAPLHAWLFVPDRKGRMDLLPGFSML